MLLCDCTSVPVATSHPSAVLAEVPSRSVQVLCCRIHLQALFLSDVMFSKGFFPTSAPKVFDNVDCQSMSNAVAIQGLHSF